LSGADLSGADLSRADLRWANLRGADLSRAIGNIFTFSIGIHQANFAGGYGSIGCERHTYTEWLNEYAAIGQRNNYTAGQIEMCGKLIALGVAWLTRDESAA
jgi:uncharacterized protein YjbI with pentapeptide repeats